MTEFVSTALPFLISVAMGYRVARLIHGPQDKCFLLGLGIGYGLTITSGLIFIQILVCGSYQRNYSLGLVLMCFAFVWILRCQRSAVEEKPNTHKFLVQALVWTSLLFAVALQVLVLAKSPHGGGLDVWAIWKFKARIFAVSDQPWNLLFDPRIKFSHSDYPIFYPLSIVWGWCITGFQSASSAIVIAVLYWIGLCGFVAAYARKNNSQFGWFFVLAVISTPNLTGYAGSLYADSIIAYYFLLGVGLMVIGFQKNETHYYFASGFFLAASGLIKNEGLAGWVVGAAIVMVAAKKMKYRFIYAVGSSASLICIYLFKNICPVQSHMISFSRLRDVVQRGDIYAYLQTVISSIAREMVKENSWVYGWIFIGLVLFICFRRIFLNYHWVPFLFGMVMLTVYVGVYLMTFRDLEGHLRTSLERILLHVYPLLMLGALMILSGLFRAQKPQKMPKDHTF